jgi:AraC-like DNA-binding protein
MVPERVFQQIKAIHEQRTPFSGRFGPKVDIGRGMENRTVPSEYYLDGSRRGGDPAHPYFVFQYTLKGWGIYHTRGVDTRVEPEMAFTAVIPGPHVYYLPPASPTWQFFYLVVHHPYVVSRMSAAATQFGAVVQIPHYSLLFAKLVHLFEHLSHEKFRDPHAQELALFDFMIEYERHVHAQQISAPAGDRLLDETRGVVLEKLSRPLSVEDLAAKKGMSRSHFSHDFKAATGLSPAQFITQVRLQEVARRLVNGSDKLEIIARDTGFADANHLCKVFRRHYHISPGIYRRQMK